MAKKRSPRKTPAKDDRYMGLAFWHASFSKDPDTQVGAVIVNSDNVPLGTGYNGPPRGVKDSDIDWSRPAKYDRIIHAEENAIDHCPWRPKGSTIYVTAIPCHRCMNKIAQHGISKVVYFPFKADQYSSINDDEIELTKQIARDATPMVTLEEFKGNINWIRDRICAMERMGIFD